MPPELPRTTSRTRASPGELIRPRRRVRESTACGESGRCRRPRAVPRRRRSARPRDLSLTSSACQKRTAAAPPCGRANGSDHRRPSTGDEIGAAHRTARLGGRTCDTHRRELRGSDRDDTRVEVRIARRALAVLVGRLLPCGGIDGGLAGSVVVAHPHSFVVDSSTSGVQTRVAAGGREEPWSTAPGPYLLLIRYGSCPCALLRPGTSLMAGMTSVMAS